METHEPTAYEIVTVPAVSPDATPAVDIVASSGLLLVQEPPEVLQLSVAVPPAYTKDGPVIGAIADTVTNLTTGAQLPTV